MKQAVSKVPSIVRRLYSLVRELEGSFPRRTFTPDGHLVGSIGDVIAAYGFGLQLLSQSEAGHDAETQEGRRVEVKTTQGASVSIRSTPDHLLVLQLRDDGRARVIFNGPGSIARRAFGARQANGQRKASISRLKRLQSQVPEGRQLPIVRGEMFRE